VIDGILYFTLPDHAWAVDARNGREKGGIRCGKYKRRHAHIGNRGMGHPRRTPEHVEAGLQHCCAERKDGKERWHKHECDLDQFYYGSTEPHIIRNHSCPDVSARLGSSG